MNDQYDKLLSKPGFFNRKSNDIIEKKETELVSYKNLVKLNIASGPNIFPYDGWINYDKDDSASYFRYLDWQNQEKTIAYVLHEMPEHQQKLANYIRSGDMDRIKFHVKDITAKFPEHEDNSVDLIYLGQMIEHLNPVYQTLDFLKECNRIMKPGGVIRITTPDLDLLIKAYLNGEMSKFENEQPDFYRYADPASQLCLLMYGASGPNCTWTNYEGHMFLFTKRSMIDMLEKAGFKDIEFYYEAGKSKHPVMQEEVVDAGLSHSFICEAVK